jgi:hypothetical protein
LLLFLHIHHHHHQSSIITQTCFVKLPYFF